MGQGEYSIAEGGHILDFGCGAGRDTKYFTGHGYKVDAVDGSEELYRKGNSEEEFCNILQKNMLPVYDSARRQGYEVWRW